MSSVLIDYESIKHRTNKFKMDLIKSIKLYQITSIDYGEKSYYTVDFGFLKFNLCSLPTLVISFFLLCFCCCCCFLLWICSNTILASQDFRRIHFFSNLWRKMTEIINQLPHGSLSGLLCSFLSERQNYLSTWLQR